MGGGSAATAADCWMTGVEGTVGVAVGLASLCGYIDQWNNKVIFIIALVVAHYSAGSPLVQQAISRRAPRQSLRERERSRVIIYMSKVSYIAKTCTPEFAHNETIAKAEKLGHSFEDSNSTDKGVTIRN